MSDHRQIVYTLTLLICLHFAPVMLAPSNNQLSENNDQNSSEAFKNVSNSDIAVEERLNKGHILESSNKIKVEVNTEVYNEHDCQPSDRSSFSEQLEGTIEDNTIGFTFQNEQLLGYVQISPDSNLRGFNVDTGLTDYSNGLQFHFNDNQLLCRNEKAVYQTNSAKAEICVGIVNTQRGPGRQIKACFYLGGAILSSKYYDINTINTFNGMTAMLLNLGCYTANDSTIYYNGQIDNNSTLSATLEAIVQPLHKEICSSAHVVSPLLIALILTVLFVQSC